jgi:hypothetical protein
MASTADERQRKVEAAWTLALVLEGEGKLEEAEKALFDAIDHLGVFSQVAYMYELRMERLLKAGDREGAIDAFKRSDRWMWIGASNATSGGEGTAMSNEAARHRETLVAALGFDPGDQ